MSVMRSVLRQTAATAVTTLMIQVATLVILATAPMLMTSENFARLSIIVATTMLANAFWDLGLNLTSTKFYGDLGQEAPFRAAFRVRLLCLMLSIVLWGLLAMSARFADVGLGVFLGGATNVWNGLRATDQARQDYRSFSRASILFAGMRLLIGAAALILTRDPVVVAIGLYLLPLVAGMVSASWKFLKSSLDGPQSELLPMLRYALYVYLGSLTFIALPYIPQFLIAHRFDASTTGTYGLIMTFTGPISLVVYAVRSVLLPKMLGSDRKLELALWSPRGGSALVVIVLLSWIAGGALGFVLQLIYSSCFPHIGESFAIFFAGYSTTAAIGLYSLSVHTLGVPHVQTWTGLAKIFSLIPLLNFWGTSLMAIVEITAGIMIAGELTVLLLLFRERARRSS